MRSLDEGRYDSIAAIEERLAAGEVAHPLTGKPLVDQLAKEDQPVELEPEDEIWLQLFDQMHGAVPPDGNLPVPSEENLVFDRLGIRHPDNREFVRSFLRYMWGGRAAGMSAKFEKAKPEKKKGR